MLSPREIEQIHQVKAYLLTLWTIPAPSRSLVDWMWLTPCIYHQDIMKMLKYTKYIPSPINLETALGTLEGILDALEAGH